MPVIVLHQWSISPFCNKVRKLLDFKGLPYSLVEYGGIRALKAKTLSAVGKLPVLDYDGVRVQDSSAIARFIEARHPTPSLWPGQVDRDLAHLLEDWADEALYALEVWLRIHDEQAMRRVVAEACAGRPKYEHFLFRRGYEHEARGLIKRSLLRYPEEQVRAMFVEHLDALEGRLSRSTWLAGDAPSMADIAVSAQLDEVVRSCRIGEAVLARPSLSAWLTSCTFPTDGKPPATGVQLQA
jgi:glutathione S-transferase